MLTREALLTYRNNNEYIPNTALHEAILNNNVRLATDYVELDKNGFTADGRSIINVRSGGNTALLLALKRGDMDTALAILAHPDVDISLCDNNNLSALHWACMLRQDDVIRALIDKGADPLAAWVLEGGIEPQRKTPQSLYEHQVDVEKFRQYYAFPHA
jgi:ankyrin repeat protein